MCFLAFASGACACCQRTFSCVLACCRISDKRRLRCDSWLLEYVSNLRITRIEDLEQLDPDALITAHYDERNRSLTVCPVSYCLARFRIDVRSCPSSSTSSYGPRQKPRTLPGPFPCESLEHLRSLSDKTRPWAMGRGPRAVGRGPWTMGRGPWAVGCGPWAVGGSLAVDRGLYAAGIVS